MMSADDKTPLEISWDELKHVTPPPPVKDVRRVTTSGAQMPLGTPAGSGGALDRLMPTAIWQGLVAGLVGGVAAWIAGELVPKAQSVQSYSDVLMYSAIWSAAMGLAFSLAITLTHSLLNQTTANLAMRVTVSALAGGACGFFGGMAGQYIYTALLVNQAGPGMSGVVLARTIGWAVLGLGAGLGQAINAGSNRRMLNGLLGGGLGGAIGGLLFDAIGRATEGAAVSRFVGMLALGLAVGGGIGLIARLRRNAMLKVVGGPFFGKEFLIDTPEVRVGRDGTNHIVLFKDPGVLPHHVTIRTRDDGYRLEPAPGLTTVMVNERHTGVHRLQNGDVIQVGSSALRFLTQ